MTAPPKDNARYTGSVCYIDRDWIEVRRSRIPWGKPRTVVVLHAGWHYATMIDKNGNEVPDPRKRLHLNDANPSDPYYEIAGDGHASWFDKHGAGNVRMLERLR